MFNLKKTKPIDSPVLVIDALGISARINSANKNELVSLVDELDHQFFKFRAKIPNSLVIVTKNRVFGTSEFMSLRLNDMFVLFSNRVIPDFTLRYLISASLLYQQLVLSGFIPRGGLGFGAVYKKKDMIIGKGFLDAYQSAEQRDKEINDICAIRISTDFMKKVESTEQSYRLLCFYKGNFFINPTFMTDPDMGEFNNKRILDLLEASGTNQVKLDATEDFLENFENYDDALKKGSKSRSITEWSP